MSLTWSGRLPGKDDKYSLMDNYAYSGSLYRDGIKFWWRRWPHEDIVFHALSLEEAKQIALSIWAIQESVGVKNVPD